MQTSLAVRVRGVDADGNSFTQETHTVNISRRGARLAWLSGFRGIGDTVELQHGREKAPFRIVWVGEVGTPVDNQVGLVAVEPKKYIWGVPLPPPVRVDDGLPPPAPVARRSRQPEQRRRPRYDCMGGVQVCQEGAESVQAGTLAEISLGGCYIETEWPLPANTRVRVELRLGGVEIQARGKVAYMHPSFGMGVVFTEMTPEDRQRLEQVTSRFRPLAAN